jgi:hypothetical protein
MRKAGTVIGFCFFDIWVLGECIDFILNVIELKRSNFLVHIDA